MRFVICSIDELPRLAEDDARERLVAMYAERIPDDWDGDAATMRPSCGTCGVKLTARHNCAVYQANLRRHTPVPNCPGCGLRMRSNHACKAGKRP